MYGVLCFVEFFKHKIETKKIMKTKTLSAIFILIAVTLFSVVSKASEGDSTTIEKKVIKIVKSDEKETVVIDSTITTKDGKTVVHVDTTLFDGPNHIGGPRHAMRGNRVMGWTDKNGESFTMHSETNGDSTHVMIIGKPIDHLMEMEPDHEGFPKKHKKVMMIHDNGDFPAPPPPPAPPYYFSKKQGMIDLNDPSIISFEKKVQKDGTEKITIVRKLE